MEAESFRGRKTARSAIRFDDEAITVDGVVSNQPMKPTVGFPNPLERKLLIDCIALRHTRTHA